MPLIRKMIRKEMGCLAGVEALDVADDHRSGLQGINEFSGDPEILWNYASESDWGCNLSSVKAD
ncbi:MAG: hypothetical protein ACJAVK_001170 [Akkermansiaceae bacterium]|jgi:hypothetical protein